MTNVLDDITDKEKDNEESRNAAVPIKKKYNQ